MNSFSGIRSVFDAADALLRRVKSACEPDGIPHATLARGLVDVTGKIIATADAGLGLPQVLTSLLPAVPFHVTAALTSAAAAAGVTVLADTAIPSGKKVYITGFTATVNGATNWATTTTVTLKDSASAPVSQFVFACAGLTGNATLQVGSANVTSQAAFLLGSGSTAGKGLVLAGNANGTGSDLVLTVWGFIK
jgi:hypothetical protein